MKRIFSAIMVLFTEEVHLGDILRCWLPLCYAGILSMGIAYTLQIVGQQYLPDAIKDTVYYTPGDNKTEQAARAYYEFIVSNAK